MWENIIVNFLEISEILISSWIFKKSQFQLLVYVCMGGWEVRYHIADYVEKNKNGGHLTRCDSLYL
jgi:hypothetical protein